MNEAEWLLSENPADMLNHLRRYPTGDDSGGVLSKACSACEGEPHKHPCLRVPTVLAIAQRVYDERAFDRLPILADALEDAGCTEEALLRHLRGEERCLIDHEWRGMEIGTVDAVQAIIDWGRVKNACACKGTSWRPLRSPHYRGCWSLDLVLGKE